MEVDRAVLEDLAQEALFHELPRAHRRRVEAVLEGHLGGAAIVLEGGLDLAGLGKRGGDGLIAIDMLLVPQG